MNELERKSFYSFLGLYIASSFLFLSLVGYWYYEAQKSALKNESYYKLRHISDVVSGDIIVSHMNKKPLKKIEVSKDIYLALISTMGEVVSGKIFMDKIPQKAGYFKENGYDTFVSDAPKDHLGIKYVVVQSNSLQKSLFQLQMLVISAMIAIAFFLVVIAWILSRLFMKPLRQKVEQIEQFINDVTHELNTPVTALSMSANQALKKGKCSRKMLNNISISTKQLYDIYSSLTYLSFSSSKDVCDMLDLSKTIKKSVDYYSPIAQMKHIDFNLSLEFFEFAMPQSQASLLFGNLIGNAIKYSSVKSTVTIELKEGVFRIKDEGIGIAKEKKKEIFEKFKRATKYSGGFGVGLSIVKSICDTYDIKIELDSVLGKGAEFKLCFGQNNLTKT